jgi:hypothetical protein
MNTLIIRLARLQCRAQGQASKPHADVWLARLRPSSGRRVDPFERAKIKKFSGGPSNAAGARIQLSKRTLKLGREATLGETPGSAA